MKIACLARAPEGSSRTCLFRLVFLLVIDDSFGGGMKKSGLKFE